MKPAELATLPDWPAVMDLGTAVLYLGGKVGLLEALEARGYLERFTDRHRCVTFLRKCIDAALEVARLNDDDLSPRPEDDPDGRGPDGGGQATHEVRIPGTNAIQTLPKAA